MPVEMICDHVKQPWIGDEVQLSATIRLAVTVRLASDSAYVAGGGLS